MDTDTGKSLHYDDGEPKTTSNSGISDKPQQISRIIQQMADAATEAEYYGTDGYFVYLDAVFSGKHICNVRDKNDTFTVEGINVISQHWRDAADAFPESRKISRRSLQFLYGLTTALASGKNSVAPAILEPLFHL